MAFARLSSSLLALNANIATMSAGIEKLEMHANATRNLALVFGSM